MLLAASLIGCAESPVLVSATIAGQTMGTTYRVVINTPVAVDCGGAGTGPSGSPGRD